MLEGNYSDEFQRLVSEVDWDIELPVEWSGYFAERGEIPSHCDDDRNNQRLKVRTYGILWFDRSLPFCPRTKDPVGIYTRDFSRHGVGFLSPFQIYPEERVRIILPTFWLQLGIMRARRITSRCYEIGARLTWRHDPSTEAFDLTSHVAGVEGRDSGVQTHAS